MREEFERRKREDFEKDQINRKFKKANFEHQKPQIETGGQKPEMVQKVEKSPEKKYFRDRDIDEVKTKNPGGQKEKEELDIFGNKKVDRIVSNRSQRFQNKRQ